MPGVYDAFRTNRSALDAWPLDEQIVWHHAAVQSQMEQLYYGLAIAVALNRTIILPQASLCSADCQSTREPWQQQCGPEGPQCLLGCVKGAPVARPVAVTIAFA